MTTLLAVRGLREKTDASFRRALVAMAVRLGFDPNFITPVMANESGFNPQAVNPLSNATGLIQFIPSTATRLGTTVDEIGKMSAEEQLVYVEKYYQPYASGIKTPGDSYMAVFMPKYIGQSPDTVIATSPSKTYTQNNTFDHTKKGYITVGDVEATSEALYAAALSKPPIVDNDVIDPKPLPSTYPPVLTAGISTPSGGAGWFLMAATGAYFAVRWASSTRWWKRFNKASKLGVR